MDTISLPFPNVQFQNVNYFLSPLRVGHIREKNGHFFCLFPNERKIVPPLYELFYLFLSPRLIVNQLSNYKHVSAQKVPSSPCPKKWPYFVFLFHSQNLKIYCNLWGATLPGRKNWLFLYCISKRIGAIFLSFFIAKLLNDYF